jgi:hypothetical protein
MKNFIDGLVTFFFVCMILFSVATVAFMIITSFPVFFLSVVVACYFSDIFYRLYKHFKNKK